jgi:hypothetical protein
MIRLILKAPLTEGNVATIVLEMTDHICEVFLLKFIQLLEAFS